MKRVSDFIRINTTPNPDYPSGQIKDATDKYTEDGTVINQNFIQDWYNFFQKCVRDSGIVPSGDFDTATNAQLFDAVMGTPKVDITTFYGGITAGTGGFRVWKTLGGKELRIEGWLSGGTIVTGMDVFQLPVGYRPTKRIFISALAGDSNITSGNLDYNPATGIFKMYDTIGGEGGLNNYINASIPLD